MKSKKDDNYVGNIEMANNDRPVVKHEDSQTQLYISDDGEIYLPKTRKIDFKSNENEIFPILSDVLPKEIGEDLIAYEKARRPYTVGTILLILCMFVCFMLLVVHTFPADRFRPLSLTDCKIEWLYVGNNMDLHSPYIQDYNNAVERFRDNRKHDVIESLKKIADEIAKKGKSAIIKNGPLLFVYLSSASKIDAVDNLLVADKFASADPDDSNWKYFSSYCMWRRAGTHEETYTKIREGYFKNIIIRNPTVMRLEKLYKQIEENIKNFKDEKNKLGEAKFDNNLRTMDYLKADILLSLWMLKGGKDGSTNFYDNKDERGVQEREDAVKILKNYENDLKFKKMEVFIMDRIIDNWYGMDDVFYNGRYWKRSERENFESAKNDLKKMIEQKERKL